MLPRSIIHYRLCLNKKIPGFDEIAYRQYAKEVEKQPINSLRDMVCSDVYSFYRCIEEKPTKVTMWVMKEVGGNTDQVLSAFRQMFFQGKIVSILRNPLSITRSVLLNRKKRGKKLSSKKIFKQVYEPIKVLFYQSRLIKDNSIHFVAYEFITGGFLKDEMAGVCRYLGLPYSPSFERATIILLNP